MSSASAILTLFAKRHGEALLWGIICLLLSFWTFFLFLCFSANTPDEALFLARTLNYVMIFLPAVLFHFCVFFVQKTHVYKKVIGLYYGLSLIYFVCAMNAPDLFLHSPTFRFDAFWFPYAGDLFYVFPVLYLVVVGHGIYILMRASVKQNKAQKRKIQYLLTTICLGLVGAGSSLTMEFGFSLPPYGILSIAVVVLIATYAILRHDLLDLPETFSLITARALVYIVIFAVVVGFIKIGAFFDNLMLSNFQMLIVSMLMVLICELYAVMKSRVQYLSDSMLTRRKMTTDRDFKSLITQLESASDFESMLPLLRSFFEKQTFIYHYAWYLDQALLVQSLKKETVDDFERSQQADTCAYQRILFSSKDGRRHDRLPASLRVDMGEQEFSSAQMVELMNGEQMDQAYAWVEQVPQRELIALPLTANGRFRGLLLFVVSQQDTQYADHLMLRTLCAKLSVLTERFDAITEESRIQQAFLLDKMHSLQTLASEVAYEMKSPLSQMDEFASEVYTSSRTLQHQNTAGSPSLDALASQLRGKSNSARLAIDRGIQSIDVILRQVSVTPIELRHSDTHSIQNVISKALAEYVFIENERQYVSCELTHDFTFLGDQQLLVCVVFSLLKEALYPPQYANDFEIVISSKAGSGDSANRMNWLKVSYNPLSAMKHNLHEQTGLDEVMSHRLGIAYCYKAMKAMGGELTYDDTENGKITISLGFPIIE